MSEIKTFSFNNSEIEKIRSYKYGSDWPIVYIIEDGKELYVGETIRAYSRTKQHLENESRRRLKSIHIISDDESNKSATLDIESSLIEYLIADGNYVLQNGNGGLQNHGYFDREKYQGKFELIWKKLQELGIAKKDLVQIRNSDLFKYSPYKTLTDDQFLITVKLLKNLETKTNQTHLINGGPGTGKTILATFLLKQLVEQGENNIAIVIAMTSLRRTLRNVFRNIPGLKSSMVIGPGDVVKNQYNILIVDEAHRLRRRKNIPNYGMFDKTNQKLSLDNEGDELDWVLKSANQVILFYDKHQSVRPSDILHSKILQNKPIEYQLKAQIRIKGGEDYLNLIDNILEGKSYNKISTKDYDFKLYENLEEMIKDIKQREYDFKLCRVVAGYAWEWISRNNPNDHDIVIGDVKLKWNSQTQDWVNSKNAINEVGCIHTIQGYDLNYTGVIIGPELSFNTRTGQIVVKRENYLDSNGHRGVTDSEELKRYVINIYKTLLTRGILGTYVYVVDKDLRDYFKSQI